MLLQRILSALVAIPLIAALVYIGGHYYAGLIILALNLGMGEYLAFIRSRGYHLPGFIGYVGVTLLPGAVYLGSLLDLELTLPAIIFMAMTAAILMLIYFGETDIQELALIFWGIIYLGGFGSYMILLRQMPQGLTYSFLFLFGVWANDTFAYFVGLKWGRRRLAPAISPKKSVEGACGGIAGTIIPAVLVALLFPIWSELTPWKAVLLGLGIAVFAQLGDLFESAMKRQFRAKDAGVIIPGHGGILDRLDSLLFAVPMVYYFFQLLG